MFRKLTRNTCLVLVKVRSGLVLQEVGQVRVAFEAEICTSSGLIQLQQESLRGS